MSDSTATPPSAAAPTLIPPDQLRYWLALHRAPGVGPVLFKKILTITPDLRELFDSAGATLSGKLSLREKTRAFLRRPDWVRVEQDLRWADTPNRHIIALPDSQYPQLLREIADPPPLLFVHGDP